jgi:photosystem II stability/assembly factor-like uncharacterized protein
MNRRLALAVGTQKGAFVFRTDERREKWTIDGPLFRGWKVTAFGLDGRGRYLAATASDVYGAALHRSSDLKTWKQIDHGPKLPEGAPGELKQIWFVAETKGVLYAGVDDAALFSSADGGDSWRVVNGLSNHPSRPAWFPGAGGMCAHSFLADAATARRLWCGISAVGVFRSDDGGATWTPKNQGVPVIIEDKNWKDIGYCVHAIAHDPANPDVIWRQDHRGMFRTRDGGDSWTRIENGLPSSFGFPLARQARTGSLFSFPLESDEYRLPPEGKLRVFRSRDGGDSWQPLGKGLPTEPAYSGVLRSAMATDDFATGAGVYFGTTSGEIFASRDDGDSWTALPGSFPRILTVRAFTEA